MASGATAKLRSEMDDRFYNAVTLASLTGKAPKSYGKGRRCACGAIIMEYRKGSKCGLCEEDPGRAARVLAAKREEQAAMLGRNKWKSRDYPDGCRECPEGEKFLRRHASGGLCSLHYQRARKAGRDVATEAQEIQGRDRDRDRAEGATVRLHRVVDTGVDLPATEGEVEAGETTLTLVGGEHDQRLDGRLERASGGFTAGGPVTDGERRERHEQTDGSDAQEPLDERLLRRHSEALAEHFDVIARIEQTLGVYNELVGLSARTARLVTRAARDLERIGIDTKLAPGVLRASNELDAEVGAMEALRLALEPLERDAQLRSVKWALSRYELDRPLVQSPASGGAATISQE